MQRKQEEGKERDAKSEKDRKIGVYRWGEVCGDGRRICGEGKGGWAAPTRKLTPKPSLTTRPLGRRAIRRLTVRRPIRLPGPLLLSSLGQIESRAAGVYTRRGRADIVHESIRNQFLEPRKDRSSWGSPALTCNAHARTVTRLHLHEGERDGGWRKRKKEGGDVYNDPRKLVNSQGRSVALRGGTQSERGTGLLSEILFSFRVVILRRRCSTTTPVAYAPALPPSFDQRPFYLCSFLAHFRTVIRGRDGYGGWGREIPTSLRRCCCATVRPFHRNRSKLARCPSVCLIEIRTVTVAGDERSLQPMLVKIASTDCWAF